MPKRFFTSNETVKEGRIFGQDRVLWEVDLDNMKESSAEEWRYVEKRGKERKKPCSDHT